jgi:hypothetical protein
MNDNGITVKNDEYIVLKMNEKEYLLCCGGVGLQPNQLQNLINGLKENGIIPTDAQVLPGVLPSTPTPEMIANGTKEIVAKLGDYSFRKVGEDNYLIKDANDMAITATNVTYKGKSQALRENAYNSTNTNYNEMLANNARSAIDPNAIEGVSPYFNEDGTRPHKTR